MARDADSRVARTTRVAVVVLVAGAGPGDASIPDHGQHEGPDVERDRSIFGKHTDYAGGHSLLAAVPRGIALVARSRTDGIVRIGDIFDGQVVEVDRSGWR